MDRRDFLASVAAPPCRFARRLPQCDPRCRPANCSELRSISAIGCASEFRAARRDAQGTGADRRRRYRRSGRRLETGQSGFADFLSSNSRAKRAATRAPGATPSAPIPGARTTCRCRHARRPRYASCSPNWACCWATRARASRSTTSATSARRRRSGSIATAAGRKACCRRPASVPPSAASTSASPIHGGFRRRRDGTGACLRAADGAVEPRSRAAGARPDQHARLAARAGPRFAAAALVRQLRLPRRLRHGSAAVSAWAGIHYFACRRRGAERGSDTVLTAPEGNAWLVAGMLRSIEANAPASAC
jgi:hypothetical protein